MHIIKSQQMPCCFGLAVPCVSSGIPDSSDLYVSLFGTSRIYGLGLPLTMLPSFLSRVPQFSCVFEPWAALVCSSVRVHSFPCYCRFSVGLSLRFSVGLSLRLPWFNNSCRFSMHSQVAAGSGSLCGL
jgi:hypothetical protein